MLTSLCRGQHVCLTGDSVAHKGKKMIFCLFVLFIFTKNVLFVFRVTKMLSCTNTRVVQLVKNRLPTKSYYVMRKNKHFTNFTYHMTKLANRLVCNTHVTVTHDRKCFQLAILLGHFFTLALLRFSEKGSVLLPNLK